MPIISHLGAFLAILKINDLHLAVCDNLQPAQEEETKKNRDKTKKKILAVLIDAYLYIKSIAIGLINATKLLRRIFGSNTCRCGRSNNKSIF